MERFNRTLKTKMLRYFAYKNIKKWLDILPKLMTGYNASVHRSIGMAPKNVNKENEFNLWQKHNNVATDTQQHLKVGDHVRVSK